MMAEMTTTIGVLGLGAMGGPMARNLAKAGYEVVGYDPNGERQAECVEAGVIVTLSEDEVATRADVVLLSLVGSPLTERVAEEHLLPNAREGWTVIDAGTTRVSATRRLVNAFALGGAAFVDAPVSGGPGGSEKGELRVFVGGEVSAVERVRPILDVIGDPERVVYCGPSGSGQVAKGVNQLAMGLVSAAYLEAVSYGVNEGIDAEALIQSVGGDEGFRSEFARHALRAASGEAEGVHVKYPELPYFLEEAREQGFAIPLAEALYYFCGAVEPDRLDNVGRPTISFWKELTERHKRPHTSNW